MAGAASNSVRSAYVAETVSGTIPATPGFVTSDDLINVRAVPILSEQSSQRVGGARSGHGVQGLDVTGTREGAVIYGVDDLWLESLLQGSWTADVLKDAKELHTLAIENAVPRGQGGAYDYHRYRGVEAIAATYTMQARSDVMRSMDLLGIGADDVTATAVAGATYADPTETDVMTTGTEIGSLTIGAHVLPCIFSLEVELAFDSRQGQPRIQTNDLCGVTRGAFKPIIRARLYVENAAAGDIMNASRTTHTAFAVSFTMGSIAGKKYTWEFPTCHFGTGTLELDQPDAFVDVEILPEYDTTEGSVVKITRAVA